MKTRLLETGEILRASVVSADVAKMDGYSLLLATTAVQSAKKAISSADTEMMNRQKLAAVGEHVEGRLQLDVVSDTAIRIRYGTGTTVPVHSSPMIVGQLPLPVQCDIKEARLAKAGGTTAPWMESQDPKTVERREKVVLIQTRALRIVVRLEPFRIEVYNTSNECVCGIGGGEKDHFNNWDSFQTGVCHSIHDGSPVAVETFDLRHDEAIVGFGEQFIGLNKAGQTVDLNICDAIGVTTPRTYKCIPFFMSTRGYGVFFHHSSRMTFWVGSRSACDVQMAAEDDYLDYFVFSGTMPQILDQYTTLTGKSEVPPAWTFGYWQSKISYKSAEETLDIARQLRAHKIPCDVIHLDTHWFKADWYCDLEFDKTRFPDPAAYLRELAGMGFKVSLWQLPYIPEGSKLFDDLKAVNGFVRNQDGTIYDIKICFVGGFKGIVGVVDYTNPEAVKVHQEAFRRLFRMGAGVIKTDFGESAPLDGVYADGTPGHRMHNLYPLLYNKAVYDVTREETGAGVVWARSAWAGNQRYPLHWGGDNSPNWFNMIPQMAGGLSFGLSGFPFWSHDIGGFCGQTHDALLIRWIQMAMFISHSRIHGFGDRELYKFAPETIRICREFLELRYRMLPYILGAARQCVEQSLPMARALIVEFQADPNTWNLYDQWLLGPHLMVAPICSEENHRRVYLPDGVWTDWWTGERLSGGRWIVVTAAMDRIPLFLREGAIVPLGPVLQHVGEKSVQTLEVVIACWTGDGETRFDAVADGVRVPMVYTSRQGRHSLRIPVKAPDIVVKGFGGQVSLVRG